MAKSKGNTGSDRLREAFGLKEAERPKTMEELQRDYDQLDRKVEAWKSERTELTQQINRSTKQMKVIKQMIDDNSGQINMFPNE